MRNWIAKFTESLLSSLPQAEGASDLRLDLPTEWDERSVSLWLDELRRKLQALYAVSDGNEHAFQVAWKSLLRAIATEETRLAQLERRLSSVMARPPLPRGKHLIDLTAYVERMDGVSYLSEIGGYTLGHPTRTSKLVSRDLGTAAWCRLVRTLGRVVQAGESERLVTNHPEETEEWVTSLPTVPLRGDWMRHHTWVPSHYEMGELLYFELECAEPMHANELMLSAASPVRVLQYRYNRTGVQPNLVGSPVYDPNVWSSLNAPTVFHDGRRCARLGMHPTSVVQTTVALPAPTSGVSSRSVALLLHLYPVQRCRVLVEVTWWRAGLPVGFSHVSFDTVSSGSWLQIPIEVDEPGICESMTVQLRAVSSLSGSELLFHRLDAWFSLWHRAWSGEASNSHLVRLPIDAPFTRFGFLVNNPYHRAAPDGVRYTTALSSVQLRSAVLPAEGVLAFHDIDSEDTIRRLDVVVRGSGLGRCELVLDVPSERRVQRFRLGSEGGVYSVSFLEPREPPPDSSVSGTVYTVRAISMEERFEGTSGRSVVLKRMPWIWRSRMRWVRQRMGYYDPNVSAVDASWLLQQLQSGNLDRLGWLLSPTGEWQVSGARLDEGEWVRVEASVGVQTTLRWNPSTFAPPSDQMVVLVVCLIQVAPYQVSVFVNGSPSSPFWVELPRGGSYPQMARYALVLPERSVRFVELRVQASLAGASVAVWRRYGFVQPGEWYTPVQVQAKLGAYVLPPASVGEAFASKPPTTVQWERLQTASEQRMGEYQVWLQENQLSYQFVANRQVYMTRLYPILVEQGQPLLTVTEVRADGSEHPVSLSKMVVVPEFGLLSLSEPIASDSYLRADYVANSPDPLAVRRSPCTLNRTDYLGGNAPTLRAPQWNPNSPDYYPVLEYFHWGRQLQFSMPVSPLGDLPNELVVRYLYLPVRVQLRLVLRPDADGNLPIVRAMTAAVTTEADSVM